MVSVLSSLLGIEIANVRIEKEDKDTRIYLNESRDLFNTVKYGGYIRQVSAERVDKGRGFVFANTYKLVLFLPKDTCDRDCINILLNAEAKRTDNPEIESIRVKRYFLDSNDNVKKEVKEKIYLKYKVVIADLDVEEIICKTKINCNG